MFLYPEFFCWCTKLNFGKIGVVFKQLINVIRKVNIVDRNADIIGKNTFFIVFPSRNNPVYNVTNLIKGFEFIKIFKVFNVAVVVSKNFIKKQIAISESSSMHWD